MYSIISVDVTKCTGCRTCELFCSTRNAKESNPARARLYVVRSEKDERITSVPVICQQCEDALCVKLCPADALVRDTDTHAVIVDEERCLGCRTCVQVCPFGAPYVDPRLGVCQKCTLCEGDPWCVKACPNEALTFVAADEVSVHRKRAAVGEYLAYLEKPTD